MDGQDRRRRMQSHFLTPQLDKAERRGHLADELHLVATGDQTALETVYKLTSSKLYALLLRMLPEAMADDVLQEVYLTVWRRADTYDPAIASPITWLVTIARNKAIDRLRADGVTGKTHPLDEVAFRLTDPAPSSLARIEDADEARRLHACLSELDEAQAHAIRDAFFGGLTYQQLAEKRNVPLGTMKSWIRRELARLKDCLER